MMASRRRASSVKRRLRRPCAFWKSFREKPARAEILALARRGFADPVVETGNQDFAGPGVVARGDERAQLAHGIAGRPARGARVHGLVAGLQADDEGQESAQPDGMAGCLADGQMVSETMIESVCSRAGSWPSLARAVAKLGLPISSSHSHRNWKLSFTDAARARRAAKSAVRAGPLSSVAPRPW
jgi:hypothetical protein